MRGVVPIKDWVWVWQVCRSDLGKEEDVVLTKKRILFRQRRGVVVANERVWSWHKRGVVIVNERVWSSQRKGVILVDERNGPRR